MTTPSPFNPLLPLKIFRVTRHHSTLNPTPSLLLQALGHPQTSTTTSPFHSSGQNPHSNSILPLNLISPSLLVAAIFNLSPTVHPQLSSTTIKSRRPPTRRPQPHRHPLPYQLPSTPPFPFHPLPSIPLRRRQPPAKLPKLQYWRPRPPCSTAGGPFHRHHRNHHQASRRPHPPTSIPPWPASTSSPMDSVPRAPPIQPATPSHLHCRLPFSPPAKHRCSSTERHLRPSPIHLASLYPPPERLATTLAASTTSCQASSAAHLPTIPPTAAPSTPSPPASSLRPSSSPSCLTPQWQDPLTSQQTPNLHPPPTFLTSSSPWPAHFPS